MSVTDPDRRAPRPPAPHAGPGERPPAWIPALLAGMAWCWTALAGVPPVAQNDQASTDDATPVLIDVQANDSDADGSALSVRVDSEDCPGTVINYQDGTLAFYPSGPIPSATECQIHYTILDGSASATAVAVLTVEPSGGGPTPCSGPLVADAESFLVTPGEPFAIARSLLLAGDLPAGEVTLDFEPATQPTRGTLTPTASSFVYTPGGGFTEPDSFLYRIRCTSNPTDAAEGLVQLVPNAGGAAPVATPNNFKMAQQNLLGAPAELTVFFHQVLADDVPAQGGVLHYQDHTPVSDGNLNLHSISWNYFPPPGFADTATWSYRIAESGNPVLSNFAEVSVAVHPAPVGVADAFSTPHDTPRSLDAATDLLANDQGFDLALHLAAGSLTAPAHGAVSESAPGVLVYTPDPDFFGIDTFTYGAANELTGVDDDWLTTSAPTTVEITVEPPPIAAGDDRVRVGAGEASRQIPIAHLLANDGAGGELVITQLVAPALGTIQISGDLLIYTPSPDFFTFGRDDFRYTVGYAQGPPHLTATATVFVELEPACDELFADGFDTGDLSRWSHQVAVGGSLAVIRQPDNHREYRLAVEVDSGAAYVFVRDDSTVGETDLAVSFWVDAGEFAMAEGSVQILTKSGDAGGALLRQAADGLEVALAARADDGGWHHTSWIPLAVGARHLRTDWLAASGPGVPDGVARLWIDGVLRGQLTGLDNDSREAAGTQLGALYPIAADTQGRLILDDYRSCRGPESRGFFVRDDFEGADFSAWSGTVQATGELRLSAAAALEGAQGLEVDLASNHPAGAFLYDDSLESETHYWGTFRLDADALTLAEGESFLLFGGSGPGGWVTSLRVGLVSGQKTIRVIALEDDLSFAGSAFHPLPSGTVDVAIEWWAASGTGKSDGGAQLALNGQVVGKIEGLDNDLLSLDRASVGAVAGLDAGTTGSFYLDRFDSWRGFGSRLRTLTDDFESGDLSAWTRAVGPVRASAEAAVAGAYGLEVDLRDPATQGARVDHELGGAERRLRLRLELDPSALTLPEGTGPMFLSSGGDAGMPFLLRLWRLGGLYQLGAIAYQDDGNPVYLPWLPLSGSAQAIFLEWSAATFPGALDGILELSAEGSGTSRRDDLDTDTKNLTVFSLGAPWAVTPAMDGFLYIDNFEAWR